MAKIKHKNGKSVKILMADDDPDDRLIFQEAVEEARLDNDIEFVFDGQELMDHLKDPKNHPDLILLDLNMPRMDGREALKLIKSDEKLRKIPVIILTTSDAEDDLVSSYDLGANSYIQKPVTFDKFVELAATVSNYWFTLVKLPAE